MRSRKPVWVLIAVLMVAAIAYTGHRRTTRPVPKTTPLYDAVMAHDPETVRSLLDGGADPNQVFGVNRSSCLAFAVSEACFGRLVGPRNGIRPWASGPQDAARRDEIVDLLLRHGADVNQANRHGRTPIFPAASTCDVDYLRKLIDRGASVKVCDDEGSTPLFSAVRYAMWWWKGEAVDVLVSAGSDPNERDKNGRTLIHRIVLDHLDGPVKTAGRSRLDSLVANGADINAKDILGLTPVDYARTPEDEAELRKHGGKGLGE